MSDYPKPSLTADILLLKPNPWRILLIKRKKDPFKNCWAIPGGFVNEGESPEEAAHREAEEETHIKTELRELGVFGDPGRDPRGWVVTVAYFGFVSEDTEAVADDDAKDARWFPLTKLPKLAFDHEKIITKLTNVNIPFSELVRLI